MRHHRAKHTWINRIVPPLVLVGVVGCVWYGLSSRPKLVADLPVQQQVAAATSSPSSTANQQPVANITPTVDKIGSQVQFSVDLKPLKEVQKVEFYVENKLMGAAFAEPYTVAVSENNLTAGTHTVTAKVYTANATTQTVPTMFTANPSTPPPIDTDASIQPAQSSAPAQQPQTSHVAKPTGLIAAAADDGTTAQVSWSSGGAASYQVWRDGAQIGAASSTAYADTGLTPGQTYDYQIVAVTGDGSTSDPSDQVAVTMPMQQNNAAANTPDTEQDSTS